MKFKHDKKEAGTKSLASQLPSTDCQARHSELSGLYYAGFISFTALLSCAEVVTKSEF